MPVNPKGKPGVEERLSEADREEAKRLGRQAVEGLKSLDAGKPPEVEPTSYGQRGRVREKDDLGREGVRADGLEPKSFGPKPRSWAEIIDPSKGRKVAEMAHGFDKAAEKAEDKAPSLEKGRDAGAKGADKSRDSGAIEV